jgi:hypothetical protein
VVLLQGSFGRLRNRCFGSAEARGTMSRALEQRKLHRLNCRVDDG